MRSCIALLFASFVFASSALAQLPEPPAHPSDADVAQARDRFVHGMALAQAQRWQAALDEFVRSYGLSGSPVALFNAGSALRELGRFRDARDAFDRLLADPELDDETRAAAERLRTEVAARVARLTVEDVPAGAARVAIDGEANESTEARPLELELDPGRHGVAVELAAYRTWRWEGTVEPGARLHLDAALEPVPSSSFDPLPWILGAVGAVLVAVIVGLAVADAEAQLGPRTSMVITLP